MTNLTEALRAFARANKIRLLVLHGSRARFTADVMTALRTDLVDVVDLDRAGGLLRYRIAREGQALYDPHQEMIDFRLDALRFWYDAEPALRAAYDTVLEQLP